MTEDEVIAATEAHITRVDDLLDVLIDKLRQRGIDHDDTKLEEPELSTFIEFTPKLKNTTFSADPDSEYQGYIRAMKPALDHHYANQRHHPEHFGGDVSKMNLVDVMEMLVDWVAASERHANGSPIDSININEKRFNINPQLAQILRNTVLLLQEK